MSFAFNTVLLFLVIFSGLACRRAYYSKEFSKNYIKKNTFDELIGGVFIGIILQLLGILILTSYGVKFDFKTIGFMLIGAKDDNNISNSFEIINNTIGKILVYNISLIVIGIFLGFLVRLIVRNLKLDRKWKYFRFDNEWHYILSGEILEFPSAKYSGERFNAKEIGNKYLNILTKVDDHFIVYSGILVEPFLSNEGGLDLLCMNGVKKKMIDKKSHTPSTIEHPMNIDVFVIPYNQILNLSVTYYKLEKIKPAAVPHPGLFKRIWLLSMSWAKRIKNDSTANSRQE